ncbi:hypothetical protein [Skermania sp. ID1734]|uniref:hypothetical protein n=1 Tax=Skermania sp. ID1734 TaxID=2597516 RepID=UPI0021062B22|nr:hypothetical protein [Skermania sp. ID1734]
MTVLSSPVRHGTLLLAATLGIASLVAGCADAGDSNSSDVRSIASIGKEVTVPVSPVSTNLVDGGDEPREVLTPHPPRNRVQAVTLHTENRVIQRIDDQPQQDFSRPPVTMAMSAVAAADGIDLTFGTVSSTDPTLSRELKPVTGSHAGFAVDHSGAVTSLSISPATDASDTAREAIEQALYLAVYRAVSLPTGAIGLGATWTLQQQVAGSIPLEQVTKAKLTDRDGDRLTIAVDVSQTPKSPVWNLPNGAGTLDIDSYTMHGAGSVTIDLGLPLPVQGDITIGGDQSYRDPHTKSLLRQTTSSRVQWTS